MLLYCIRYLVPRWDEVKANVLPSVKLALSAFQRTTAIVYRFASLTHQRCFLRLPKAFCGPWYVFIKEHILLAECQRTPSSVAAGEGVFYCAARAAQ